jgi:chemotaxis protein MotA
LRQDETFMDIATGVGLLAGIATVVSLIIIDGGNFAAYFDKHAVIVVFGAPWRRPWCAFPSR